MRDVLSLTRVNKSDSLVESGDQFLITWLSTTGNPLVAQDLLQRESLRRIVLEHTNDQVLELIAHTKIFGQ